MITNKRITVGVIGAGMIGNVHMKGISQLTDDYQLGAVTDVNRSLAEQRAKYYGIANVYETAEDLVQDKHINVVVISVPNIYHASLAIQALKAGKHVILEKPMGIHLEAAKKIVQVQQESGKLLMIPHQMRWEWYSQEIKDQVDKGSLGRIYNAKAGWLRRKGIPSWGSWFTRKKESGGGPLIDIGVHLLDLTLYLMGNPKPVTVSGATFAEFGPDKRGIGTWGKPNWDGIFDVEDLATAFIRMEDGRSLSLDVSWAVHAEIENNGAYVHLMGSKGGASISGKKGKLFMEHFDRPISVELEEPKVVEGSRIRMMRHFAECVREGKEPMSNAMTGFTNNLILEAIYESSRTGKEVRLDWTLLT